MINILFPLAGDNKYFDRPEYPFPKPLVEIADRPMVELAIANYQNIGRDKRFIFVVNGSDCTQFHLDNVLELLTDGNCHIVRLDKATAGAACSCLMAVDFIDNDTPLIIANYDQVLQQDFDEVLSCFEEKQADAGAICFESVHPRWSFIRTDDSDQVVESAEKNPISKRAIAGFYYFRQGSKFVKAAMRSIQKGVNLNGLHYLSSSFNELILDGEVVVPFQIEKDRYNTFYLPEKIKEYEMRLAR